MGEERLRITPTPGHTLEQMERLAASTDQVFVKLGIKRKSEWLSETTTTTTTSHVGRKLLRQDGGGGVEPLWTDEQLGLKDGTAPRQLVDGKSRSVLGVEAGKIAKMRLTHLLDDEDDGKVVMGPVSSSSNNSMRRRKREAAGAAAELFSPRAVSARA